MRILIIHNRYSHIGGEEKVVEVQRRLLSKAGHETHMYIRDYHEMDSWKLGKVQSFFSSLYSRKSVNDIKAIVKDFKPDVAIVHNLFPIISFAVIKELKRNHIPIAMTIHNYRLLCPNGLFFSHGKICTKCANKPAKEFCCLLNKCEGTLLGSLAYSIRGWWSRINGYYKFIDIFISVSRFQKSNLIKYGIPEKKITIIPNCVYTNSNFPLDSSIKEDYVCFIGRLSQEKGIDLLFDIARRIPEVKFKVAGETSLNYKFSVIPDNIEILGYLEGDKLRSLLNKALALIFTSKVWEAMPLVPLEAMSEGTVVIANNVSSIAEILDGGNAGIIFNNTEEAAEKIREIISNTQLRKSYEINGLNRVQSYYTEKQYITSLCNVCKSILQNKV